MIEQPKPEDAIRLVARQKPLLFDDLVADYLTYSERSKRSHADDKPRAARLLGQWKGRLAADLSSRDVEDFKARLAATLTAARARRLEPEDAGKPRAQRPLSVAP